MGVGDFMKDNWVELGVVGFFLWFFFGSQRGKDMRDKFLGQLRDMLDKHLERAEQPAATASRRR